MQSVCRRCRSLASTEYPCKVCGSDSSMAHTHCAEPFHYATPADGERDPNRHYWADCSETHIHPHLGLHEHDADGNIVGDAPLARRSFAEREAYLLTAPWISLVHGMVRCDSNAHGRSSMSNRPRCKNRGKYRYRALKRSWSKSGNYCWSHLPMFNDMEEEARWDRFIKKNPPEWKDDNHAIDRAYPADIDLEG